MPIQKFQVTAGAMKTKHKGEQKGTCKKVGRSKSPSKSRSPSKLDSIYETDRTDFIQKCCCESGNCIKNLQNLLDKEIEYRQVSVNKSMEDLRQEKDYYMKEYHRVLEKMRNAPTFEVSENGITQLKQQLKDKEIQIKHLEDEVKRLNKDMSSLLVDEMQGLGVNKGVCKNASCKNKERELEIKTGELNHLEIENNTLKAKLQAINETSVFNEERMKKAFKDMEEHIRKLEDERRDLVKADLTQRSNLSHLEEDYRNVRDELKQTQNELSNQRANYNQLKLLHEQTDRALSEAQAKVIYVETELANYKTKIRDSSRDTVAQDKEIAKLLSDIQFMKNQLTKLDREKDDLLNNLDEKTEKIALLEDELNAKNKLVSKLEDDLKELNRKLSKYANETSSQDQIVRAKQQEIVNLEQCYEKEKRLKEAALLENKRLQNDLSSVTCDCRDARNELEITMRQVEDLKRQLQHYVAEVKRTEDLISHKELERNELLDQFRCLSQEANILESNNHTLETEATQSKIQLSVALDHTSELERKVEHQESVIRSYEKQITDLTAHIAKLEVQLKQNSMDQEQYSTEMKQMRDLCVKLDKDKDNLKKELYSKEDRQSQVQQLTEKLNSEREALQKALEQERNSLEAVEKLLNEARRDVTEQRLLNQDLQHEVNRLKHQIEELERRLFHSCRKVEKQPTNVTEVPKSIVREDTVHFDNSLQDNSAAPTRMYGTTGKFNPEGPGKSLSRGTSLMSTKTLTMSNKFHGSDGMFHGAIDLTKLYQEESNNSLSTNNSNNDINGVSDSTFSMGMQEKPPSKIVSIISTKTLLPTKKFHGSDGLLHGVIDLTKLDQDNADCDEQCRKARCILHKNHTNAQQESKICHRYETNFDGCKKVEPKNELTKNQLNNAEVGPSYQTSENASKFVEFSHLERLNNQPDVFTNENDWSQAQINSTSPADSNNTTFSSTVTTSSEHWSQNETISTELYSSESTTFPPTTIVNTTYSETTSTTDIYTTTTILTTTTELPCNYTPYIEEVNIINVLDTKVNLSIILKSDDTVLCNEVNLTINCEALDDWPWITQRTLNDLLQTSQSVNHFVITNLSEYTNYNCSYEAVGGNVVKNTFRTAEVGGVNIIIHDKNK